jgi:hypothetical protein
VRCPATKCTAHFSSLKQLWLATHFWTCCKTGCYPNWIPIMRLHATTGRNPPPPPFLHECTSTSQSRSSTALDRTRCKWRQQPSLLATPFADLTPCYFSFEGFVKDSVYVPPLSLPIQELRDRIGHSLQAITADMLHRVRAEFHCSMECVVWPKVHKLKNCN